MVRTIFALMAVLTFGVVLLGASPVYADLQDDVDQAATIIERFQAVPEKAIPQAVLKDAKGLAIMTVIKAGFGFSGRGGKGVVVARIRNGWSGPSAIGTGGAGVGLQIGAEVTEFVMVLNTDEAVKAFSRDVKACLPVSRSKERSLAHAMTRMPSITVDE
jgi:lipid-binding SYLF domain-containing protein